MAPRIYWQEHLEWLRINYRTMELPALTKAFNLHFDMNRKKSSIENCLSHYDIKSGRPRKSNFEGRSHNRKPLGSEICTGGYIRVSVKRQNKDHKFATQYKYKHVLLWEKRNGPVPEGCVILFKDGDNRNFEDDNLIKVTRGELFALNKHNYKNQPDNLKPAILALAKLEAKAGFSTKPGRGRK